MPVVTGAGHEYAPGQEYGDNDHDNSDDLHDGDNGAEARRRSMENRPNTLSSAPISGEHEH